MKNKIAAKLSVKPEQILHYRKTGKDNYGDPIYTVELRKDGVTYKTLVSGVS